MKLDAFDEDGRRVLLRAHQAARSAHHTRIGSGHLLLGCLDTAPVRQLLERHGLDAHSMRTVLPRPAPDRELLAAIGIDLDPAEVRDRVRTTLGLEPAPPGLHRRRDRPLQIVLVDDGRRLVFGAGARKVLEVAIWRARGSHRPDWRLRQERPATARDLLAGLMADGRNPVRRLMVEHGLHVRPQLMAELADPQAN